MQGGPHGDLRKGPQGPQVLCKWAPPIGKCICPENLCQDLGRDKVHLPTLQTHNTNEGQGRRGQPLASQQGALCRSHLTSEETQAGFVCVLRPEPPSGVLKGHSQMAHCPRFATQQRRHGFLLPRAALLSRTQTESRRTWSLQSRLQDDPLLWHLRPALQALSPT